MVFIASPPFVPEYHEYDISIIHQERRLVKYFFLEYTFLEGSDHRASQAVALRVLLSKRTVGTIEGEVIRNT